jgi:hypothetical protein
MNHWWRRSLTKVNKFRMTMNQLSFVTLGSRDGVVVMKGVDEEITLSLRKLIKVELRLNISFLHFLGRDFGGS